MVALLFDLEGWRARGPAAPAVIAPDAFADLLVAVRGAAAERWPALPGPAALQQLGWLLEACRQANARLATWTGADGGSLADAIGARDNAAAALAEQAPRYGAAGAMMRSRGAPCRFELAVRAALELRARPREGGIA